MGSLEDEKRVAIEAAVAAGREVMHLRESGMRFGRKHGHELVSEADLHAAEMLHAALTGAFPDTGWLSEEHIDDGDRLRRERVWVVDPIDGTREFLQGIPEFAISVALVVDGDVVLGVVHNPATGEMFAASFGVPRLPVPALRPPPYRYLVGRMEARWDEVPPLPGNPQTIGIGSVAYRLALLAAGKGDAVVTNYGRAEWDVAAGIAICREAGLEATDVLGGALRFNKPDPEIRGLLVAHPALHREVVGHFHRLVGR